MNPFAGVLIICRCKAMLAELVMMSASGTEKENERQKRNGA